MDYPRNRKLLNEGWIEIRKFFPRVSSPLFHKTRDARVISILKKGFNADAEGNFNNAFGISFTRSFSWVKKPYIEGSFVFVLDKNDFKKSDFVPYSHPDVSDEFEERFTGNHISLNKVKGLIVLRPLYSYEKHLKELPFPVVSKTKQGWQLVNRDLEESFNGEMFMGNELIKILNELKKIDCGESRRKKIHKDALLDDLKKIIAKYGLSFRDSGGFSNIYYVKRAYPWVKAHSMFLGISKKIRKIAREYDLREKTIKDGEGILNQFHDQFGAWRILVHIDPMMGDDERYTVEIKYAQETDII